MSWLPFTTMVALAALALPSTPGTLQSSRDKLPESFTANAQFQGAAGAAATTVKIRIDRYTPDAERDAVLQALKEGGYQGFVAALRKAPVVGVVSMGDSTFDIRWARATANKNNRSIVVVTDKPMYFLGAGNPNAKSREGFDVGVLSFDVDSVGMGFNGRMAAAAKVKPGANGVEVADYADKMIELKTVMRDIK
jgi:hypothetical protein